MIGELDADAREVHFVQFEGIHQTYKFDSGLIGQLWRMYRMKAWVIDNWTITDFDHHLSGNPIIR